MAYQLPDKLYYKIGEVAEAAGVRTSVLRFWESEFAFLKPVKSGAGQRLYTRNDVELVLQVKQLLYKEKFTIEGVKLRLAGKKQLPPAVVEPSRCDTPGSDEMLKMVRTELQLLRDSL